MSGFGFFIIVIIVTKIKWKNIEGMKITQCLRNDIITVFVIHTIKNIFVIIDDKASQNFVITSTFLIVENSLNFDVLYKLVSNDSCVDPSNRVVTNSDFKFISAIRKCIRIAINVVIKPVIRRYSIGNALKVWMKSAIIDNCGV